MHDTNCRANHTSGLKFEVVFVKWNENVFLGLTFLEMLKWEFYS